MIADKKVSVVITSWNRKEDLTKTLESVASQTYPNIEVIVVDNHSTDGTVEMLEQDFCEVNLTVMSDSSRGACETFNIGFAKATGEYIAILDDDVSLPRDWIEKIIEKFCDEPQNTSLIATKIIDPKGLHWPYAEHEDMEFFCGNFIGAGAVVKTAALRETRGYAEEYFICWNEEELAGQLLFRGYTIKYLPSVQTNHKAHPSQRVSKRRFYFEVRNRIWTFALHEPERTVTRRILAHLRANFVRAISYGYYRVYLKAVMDAVKGLPRCLMKREPVRSPYWQVKG